MTNSKTIQYALQTANEVSSGTGAALPVLFVVPKGAEELLCLHARPHIGPGKLSFSMIGQTAAKSNRRGASSGWRQMTCRLAAIGKCRVVHIAATDTVAHLLRAAGYVIAGRILGKRVIFDLTTSDPYGALSPWWRLLNPVWRQVGCVRTELPELAKSLRRYHVCGALRRPLLNHEAVAPRVIRKVQPQIVALLPDREDVAFHSLLRSFGVVKRKYPRAEMTIVLTAREKPKSVFLDECDSPGVTVAEIRSLTELHTLLTAADLCLSLFWRPLTDALTLAMTAGLPVVAAGTAATRKLIQDGENGLLIEPGDHDAAAEAILRLVETPELVQQLSIHAPRAVAQFSWSRQQEHWLALYRGEKV